MIYPGCCKLIKIGWWGKGECGLSQTYCGIWNVMTKPTNQKNSNNSTPLTTHI